MPKSLLDRLSAEDYALIKDSVYYDPTSISGLRWLRDTPPGPGMKRKKGEPAGNRCATGKTIFIGQDNHYPVPALIIILNNIWPSEGQNVVTRKNPSGSWSDVQNLQWAAHGESRRKSSDARRAAHVQSLLGHEEPDLGDSRRLNALCKNNHQWNGLNLSLQAKCGKSWKCFECEKERNAERRQSQEYKDQQRQRYLASLDSNRAKARERMRAKREAMSPEDLAAFKAHAKEYNFKRWRTIGRNSSAKGLEDFVKPPHLVGYGIQAEDLIACSATGLDIATASADDIKQQLALWTHIKDMQPSPSVARLVFDQQREYWPKNPESYKIYDKERKRLRAQWRQMTDPDYVLYHRQKSKRRKAQMRDSVAIQVTGKQIRARFAEFNHRCAYCGVDGNLHIEHVIPISKGGPHALGNIVPACKDCNFSKRDHDAKRWYREQPFYSELRWRKICRVLGWSRSSVGQMALL